MVRRQNQMNIKQIRPMCEYIKNVPDKDGKFHVIFKGTRFMKNEDNCVDEDVLRGR